MGDSVIKRTSGADKPPADIPPAAPDRILDFLSEASLKANATVPFPGPPQGAPDDQAGLDGAAIEPVKVGNLISISALANATAAKPKLDDALPQPALTDAVETKGRFSRPSMAQLMIAALSVIAVAELFLLVSRSERQQPPPSAAPAAGIVAVESTPPGAVIEIDGEKRGVTPSMLSLRPGEYAMSLTVGGAVRNVRLVVREGHSSERFYFNDLDGESSSPSMMPGNAALSVTHETASARNAPGTPPAGLPPTGAVGGWLSVSAPIDLQLFEGGVLLGSSQANRIMLPVGRHVIEAVNTATGYKTSSTVQVSAGAITRLKPEMPIGTLNINAIPWAEVAVDGKALGTTPLGNVSLPIGPHDVVFTHPQLGERHQNVVVTLNGINLLSVNLNQR